MRELPSVEKMRQETVEDWVQVLVGKEVLRNNWISGPARACRLGAPGPVPWSRGYGATSLGGGMKLGVSLELSSWTGVDGARV